MSELATDYMERALPWRRWLAARWHLFLCNMCRTYFDQLRKMHRLLDRGTLPPPAPETEAAILARTGKD